MTFDTLYLTFPFRLLLFSLLISTRFFRRMAPKVEKAKKPAPKKVAEKKEKAADEKAPVKAVQKAHKVQKRVVKGVHGTRVKKVRTSVKFYRPHTYRPTR